MTNEIKPGAHWEKPNSKYAQNDQPFFQHTSGLFQHYKLFQSGGMSATVPEPMPALVIKQRTLENMLNPCLQSDKLRYLKNEDENHEC